MELNIGLLEILGEVIGEKMETLDLLEELIISVLKLLAHGLFHEILGPKIKEIKLNLIWKI
jgi:hypothetical protein